MGDDKKKSKGRDYPLSETPNFNKVDNTYVSKTIPRTYEVTKKEPTQDSSAYYGNKEYLSKLEGMNTYTKPGRDAKYKESEKAKQDRWRQALKGKAGYDENGFKKKY